MKVEKIAVILENELPEIIKNIAKDYNVSAYINNPDFLEERLYAWHQFGLLEHTKKVREIFLNELDDILKKWGLYNDVRCKLSEKIKEIERKILLEISIPPHDLGKIVVYGDKKTDRQHEVASKNLLYNNFLKKRLDNLGLSKEHIDYIGGCIEYHDVIGKKIRDKLKHENKLRLNYITKENVGELCERVAEKYFDFKLEIGIFFLCDLLGKVDIRLNAKTDNEVSKERSKIEQILKERNLHPELEKAVMQLPVNMKLTEVYLKSIVEFS